jgi:hypothetical protein
VQIFTALSLILVIVSIICAFIKGGQEYFTAYIVIAASMALILASTGVLVRWILADELPESKHSYLVGFQFLALMILSCGMLAQVYMEFPHENAVFGVATNVTGFGGAVHLEAVGMDNSAISASAPFSSGLVSTFSFPQHIKEGTDFSIKVTNPDSSLCSGSSTRTAANDVLINVMCRAAYTVHGTVAGLLKNPVVLEVSDITQPSTKSTVSVAADGKFSFPDPIIAGDTYSVTPQQQPSDATCTVTQGNTGISGPGMTEALVQCVKK